MQNELFIVNNVIEVNIKTGKDKHTVRNVLLEQHNIIQVNGIVMNVLEANIRIKKNSFLVKYVQMVIIKIM